MDAIPWVCFCDHYGLAWIYCSDKLCSIKENARQPLAFIDGRGVVPGDRIEGWEVAEITESSVTLMASDGTLKKIGLYDQPEGEVKKRSESNMQKAEVDAHY